MTPGPLSSDERALLAEATAHEALRQVLADRLLERNHPLGELLRLESERRALPRRRALEVALRETLRSELVPWARELELTSGLPAWTLASLGVSTEGEGAEWPVSELALTGSVRDAVPQFQRRALRRLQALDLSATRAPAPVPRELTPPPPLVHLDTVVLPAGAIDQAWVPFLEQSWRSTRTISVSIGPGAELPDWVLELPALERVRLTPGREPGDGRVVDAALGWAEQGQRRTLEWLDEALSPSELRRALRPALPGERVTLPEERHVAVDLVREGPLARVFRVQGTDVRVLRAEDTPAVDLFAAPRHPRLVAPAGLWRVRRGLFVELEKPGEPLGLARRPPAAALALARELLDALEAWWSTGAPDVISGEWVGLGRDQLRLRDGGLAVVPALTRRLWPDAHSLPELAGVPLAWSRTSAMATRLTGACLFEWLTGLSFLDSTVGSAFAVHRRLRHRLTHAPRPSEVSAELAPFDALIEEALSGTSSIEALRRRLDG